MISYERRRVDDLVTTDTNPRTISDRARRALTASIRRFGLVQPIVINARTGNVVGGHQRLSVLRQDGVAEVDVAVGNWSKAEERVLNVALNNPEAQGKFTADIGQYLTDALKCLSLDDFRSLRLDDLITTDKTEQKSTGSNRGLEYRLVILCENETHQAELFERLESEQLKVKMVIV